MNIGNVWYDEGFFGPLFGGKDLLIENFHNIENIDLLVFWGGSDVSPSLYKEKNKRSVGLNPGRDKFEKLVFENLVGHVPMVGICRGAQFLCAMSGGKLWQHVDNHGADHLIKLPDGQLIKTTSTHHQMMRPSLNMEILATSENLSPKKWDQEGVHEDHNLEPEICYSPETNTLMIQGHPEYNHASKDFVQLTKNLITKYLGVK